MTTSAICDAVLGIVTELSAPYVARAAATLEPVPDHPNVVTLLPRPGVPALYLAVHTDVQVCDLIVDDAGGHLGTLELGEGTGLEPIRGLVTAILAGRAQARIVRLGQHRWATALRWGPTTWSFPAPTLASFAPHRQWVEYRPYS